jgi:diaminopimelate epimerase
MSFGVIKNIDFKYRIFNADGSEVEQCGNGARCFVKFVVDKGLTDKTEIFVETKNRNMRIRKMAENAYCVNVGLPIFTPKDICTKFTFTPFGKSSEFCIFFAIDSISWLILFTINTACGLPIETTPT